MASLLFVLNSNNYSKDTQPASWGNSDRSEIRWSNSNQTEINQSNAMAAKIVRAVYIFMVLSIVLCSIPMHRTDILTVHEPAPLPCPVTGPLVGPGTGPSTVLGTGTAGLGVRGLRTGPRWSWWTRGCSCCGPRGGGGPEQKTKYLFVYSVCYLNTICVHLGFILSHKNILFLF